MSIQPSARVVFAALATAVAMLGAAGSARADIQTQTSVSASPNSSVWGQEVTFTVTVDALDGSTPTGTVTLTDQGTAIGGPVALEGGRALRSTQMLAPGAHQITAAFTPGAPTYEPSSGQLTYSVAKTGSRLTATALPAALLPGQSVTVAVAVAAMPPGGGTPTGTVRFTLENGAPLGSRDLDGAGRVTVQDTPPAGHWSIRATYDGDAHFNAASALVEVRVDQAATVTTITSSPNPVPPGGSLNVTAVVSEGCPCRPPVLRRLLRLPAPGERWRADLRSGPARGRRIRVQRDADRARGPDAEHADRLLQRRSQ